MRPWPHCTELYPILNGCNHLVWLLYKAHVAGLFEDMQCGVGQTVRHRLRARHRRHPVIAALQDERWGLHLWKLRPQIVLFAQRSHHVHADIHVQQRSAVHLVQITLLEALVPVERHDLPLKTFQLGLCCLPRRLAIGDFPQCLATLAAQFPL